jgi:hypothetical protein
MKKLNLNLLKTLVETDFAIKSFSKDTKKVNPQRINCTMGSFNCVNKVASLDLPELVKNLKQTLRLVQFANSKDKSQIFICSSNKQYLNLLKTELQNSQKKGKIQVKSRLMRTDVVDNLSQLLLLFEDPLGNRKRILKKLFEDKIYLVNKINAKVELNNWGNYKVNNDLDDFKKLIFLIVLLRQALK